MVFLEMSASISSGKMLEFNQSKLQFIDRVQKTSGYSNFIEKQGPAFQIKISWINRESLDKFINSELFHIFRGAIVTLSDKNSVIIVDRKTSVYT